MAFLGRKVKTDATYQVPLEVDRDCVLVVYTGDVPGTFIVATYEHGKYVSAAWEVPGRLESSLATLARVLVRDWRYLVEGVRE